jgi:hypothetical protein
MSKSQIRTLMCVLCLTALCAIIVGCESQATCPTKAKAAAKEPNATCEKAKATTEKPKEAVAKTKESAGEKGATMGPYNLTANWTDDQGFINSWIIVGPFPNPGTRPDCNGFNVDYLKNYGSELNIVPTNGMEIKKDDGTVVKWEQYKATATDISFFDVPHLKLEPQQTNVLCYAACWLDCDADKDVELRIGSDDGYKLWVNHKLIAEENVYRAMEMDQETWKVKLNKGKNLILLKVTQDWGDYQFTLRVVGADAKAVPGITVWN